jgi:maleylpyruvate isomerase
MPLPEIEITSWVQWVISDGLTACEALIARRPGPFCFGPAPTLADVCLVPQLFNARRFGCDLQRFPRLLDAEAASSALPAFIHATPDKQGDAE